MGGFALAENNKCLETDSFPCTGCGSQMVFDPDVHKLHCEHCGREEEIPSPVLEAPEYLYNPDTDEYTAPNWEAMGNRTVRCKGCGAQTVVSSATVTAKCPFCGSNYVVDQDEATTGILPETIMPFKVSRKRAFDQFKKWAKSRFWAPSKFKKASLMPENLAGMYLPYWTFDADLQTNYTGEGGRDYTTTHTRIVNGKPQTYTTTHTNWYPISGDKMLRFDDKTVCASKTAEAELIKGLGAYSTKMLNRYVPAFLAGFSAQRYDVGLGEGFAQVRPVMQADMESKIRGDYNYNHYRNMQYHHIFQNVRFKHILLPVWMSSYAYQGKVYRFLVNGETGSVSGKAPVSAVKVALTVVILFAIVMGIYLLAQASGGR